MVLSWSCYFIIWIVQRDSGFFIFWNSSISSMILVFYTVFPLVATSSTVIFFIQSFKMQSSCIFFYFRLIKSGKSNFYPYKCLDSYQYLKLGKTTWKRHFWFHSDAAKKFRIGSTTLKGTNMIGTNEIFNFDGYTNFRCNVIIPINFSLCSYRLPTDFRKIGKLKDEKRCLDNFASVFSSASF